MRFEKNFIPEFKKPIDNGDKESPISNAETNYNISDDNLNLEEAKEAAEIEDTIELSKVRDSLGLENDKQHGVLHKLASNKIINKAMLGLGLASIVSGKVEANTKNQTESLPDRTENYVPDLAEGRAEKDSAYISEKKEYVNNPSVFKDTGVDVDVPSNDKSRTPEDYLSRNSAFEYKNRYVSDSKKYQETLQKAERMDLVLKIKDGFHANHITLAYDLNFLDPNLEKEKSALQAEQKTFSNYDLSYRDSPEINAHRQKWRDWEERVEQKAKDWFEANDNLDYDPHAYISQEKAWLENWIKNPEFSRRIKNYNDKMGANKIKWNWVSLNGDGSARGASAVTENPAPDAYQTKTRALNELEKSKKIYVNPIKSENVFGAPVVGQYFEDDHSIALNDDRTEGVPVHEYTHASGLDENILKVFQAKGLSLEKWQEYAKDLGWDGIEQAKNSKNLIFVKNKENGTRVTKFATVDDLKNLGFTENDISSLGYQLFGQEIYPRLMEMRYLEKITPGQTFDDQQIEELINKYKSKHSFMEYLPADKIKTMFNEWASVGDKETNPDSPRQV